MATISEQKLEHRRWIAAWFESWVRTLDRTTLERQYLQAIRDMAHKRTLGELQDWRAKLEARDDRD